MNNHFSFLKSPLNMTPNGWRLAPAYDLTYSNSIGGEHATAVNGNGKNPSFSELSQVAKKAKIDIAKAEKIAKEIYEVIKTELKEYYE